MKLYEMITELRRNPTQNPKVFGHASAVKTLYNMDIENVGVSMTELPKLGINPGSTYATPVGVYFYPARYYIEVGEEGAKLEFQHDAAYIQIFKFSGDVVYTDKFGKIDFGDAIEALYANIGQVARLIGMNEGVASKELSNHVLGAMANAKVPTYFGRLWYVLYALSKSSGQKKRGAAAPRSAVIWNSLLRILGYDVIVDNGDSVLHPNEPYQGVVLNPRVIQMVTTIRNQKGEEDPERKPYVPVTHEGVLINNVTDGSKLFHIQAAFGEDGETLSKCKVYANDVNTAQKLAVLWAKKYVGNIPVYHITADQIPT